MFKVSFLAVSTLIISISCRLFTPPSVADVRDFKAESLRQINQLRKQGCYCGSTYMPPAVPLAWNAELTKAALNHAKDMSRRNYFSHNSRDGKTLKDRIVNAGYSLKGLKSAAFGENIAYGQQSIEQVMVGWIKSERHCKNLMNPAFKEVGMAEVNRYWVQDFGGRIAWK